MSVLAKIYRGQYRAVEEALESWQADHQAAMSAYDLQEAIRFCVRVQPEVLAFVKAVWQTGFAGKCFDPDEVGKSVLNALDGGVEAWSVIREHADALTAARYVVEGAAQIPVATAELQAARDDFAARWPFFRREDAEQGSREIAAGEFVTGEAHPAENKTTITLLLKAR